MSELKAKNSPGRATFVRLVVACALLSSWLGALLVGVAPGAVVHVLLVVGLCVVPWKGLRTL